MARAPTRRLTRLRWGGCVALLLVGADAGPARAQAAKPQPPATAAGPVPVSATGPSSIEETYGDWRVLCRRPVASPPGSVDASRLACVVAQQQNDERTKQRVLAMELHRPTAARADGVLVLPFGLALDQGVTLQLDGAPAVGPLRVRTCLPVGCIAPLGFDAKFIGFLRKGQVLALTMTGDDGKALTLKLSLKGIGAAIDRAVTLSR